MVQSKSALFAEMTCRCEPGCVIPRNVLFISIDAMVLKCEGHRRYYMYHHVIDLAIPDINESNYDLFYPLFTNSR
jgi:hypothetical protein